MVRYLDFTFQILIFPYRYHGNKWRIKAAGNKKPLLHNWVWAFLHRDKRAFTAGRRYSTTTSLQVPQGRDRVRLCLCAAPGTRPGESCRQDSKPWGCAAIRHQLCHARPKQTYLSHQAVLQDGEDISSLSGFPCPPPHSQGNPVETSRG